MRKYLNIERPNTIINDLATNTTVVTIDQIDQARNHLKISFQEYIEAGFAEYFGTREKNGKK